MGLIIIFTIILVSLLVLYYIFDINTKQIKQMSEDKEIDEIVNKFPDNIEICKDILKILKNEKVKIKENEDKNNKSSLYIALTDTIFIANIKDIYTRIQTIAHECLHSVQNRKVLLFNFIFSNIYITYFAISIILTIFGVFKDYRLQIIILLILGFIYYAVRSYLETDAMIKAKFLTKDYILEQMEKNKICTKEEMEKILDKYESVNKIGIPTYNYILFVNCILKVFIYMLLVLIINITF